jgi:co-chaperonin GroES (HSP10)
MVEIQPLRDRVLVKLRPLPEKIGLLYTPSRQEYARKADVISVGPECRDTRPGQVVLVPALIGQQIGESQMISESSILAYVEEAA